MSKLLSVLLAAVFAAVTITPVAFAAEKKEEGKEVTKKAPKKKAAKKDGVKKEEMKKDEMKK